MNLYPSILTPSIEEYQQQLSFVMDSQVVKVIQVDIIDGVFTDNLTLTPLDLINIDHGELEIDFHLMTEEPMDYVQELISIKDHLPIRSVIAQIERMSSPLSYLEEVKVQGWKAGFSLDLYTPVSAIDIDCWGDLDIVQLMTIESGFQGQEFNRRAFEKLTEIHQHAQSEIEIIIDGGVKADLLPLLNEKQVGGATVGSGFWRASDPVAAIQQYSQLM
jgi:ribulose-phosphate 3-epimerase